jgi:hypothetical protein
MLMSLWVFPHLVHHYVAQLFEKIAMRLPARASEWLVRILYRGHLKRST